MSRATYFVQECPTCGRQLQVRVGYLGRQVVCRHCSGRFEARDPEDNSSTSLSDSAILFERAEELLATADARKKFPR